MCWRTRSLCVRFLIWSVSLETTRMVGRKNKRNKWRASRVLHVGSQASGISFLRCVCVCVCVFIPFGFPNEMTWLIRVKDVSGDWTMTPKWRTSPQPTRNNGSAQSIQEWLRLDTLLLAFAVFLPVPPSLVESKSVSKRFGRVATRFCYRDSTGFASRCTRFDQSSTSFYCVCYIYILYRSELILISWIKLYTNLNMIDCIFS